jgi:hypothetical protein
LNQVKPRHRESSWRMRLSKRFSWLPGFCVYDLHNAGAGLPYHHSGIPALSWRAALRVGKYDVCRSLLCHPFSPGRALALGSRPGRSTFRVHPVGFCQAGPVSFQLSGRQVRLRQQVLPVTAIVGRTKDRPVRPRCNVLPGIANDPTNDKRPRRAASWERLAKGSRGLGGELPLVCLAEPGL